MTENRDWFGVSKHSGASPEPKYSGPRSQVLAQEPSFPSPIFGAQVMGPNLRFVNTSPDQSGASYGPGYSGNSGSEALSSAPESSGYENPGGRDQVQARNKRLTLTPALTLARTPV